MEDQLDDLDKQMQKHADNHDKLNSTGGDNTDGDDKDKNAGAGDDDDKDKNLNTDGDGAVIDAEDKDKNLQDDKSAGQQQQSQAQTIPADFDMNKHFEAISGGIFKTQDAFQAALQKFTDFDKLATEVSTLKAQAEVSPYADDYEKKRNELKKSGASKEQLSALEKVNDLGDLTKLDPIDAKIMKMVLVDGYPEAVARRKVEKDFPTPDVDDAEAVEDHRAELEISAKADLTALEGFKVQVSTAPAGDKIIQDTASKEKLEQELNTVLTDFSSKYSNVATLDLDGKDGKEGTIKLDIKVDDAAKAQMAADIKEIFIEGSLPLTQENYDAALRIARNNYIEKNLQNIAKSAWGKAEAHFTKFFSDKYSNADGVLNGDKKPADSVKVMSAEETRAFKKELGVDLNKAYN